MCRGVDAETGGRAQRARGAFSAHQPLKRRRRPRAARAARAFSPTRNETARAAAQCVNGNMERRQRCSHCKAPLCTASRLLDPLDETPMRVLHVHASPAWQCGTCPCGGRARAGRRRATYSCDVLLAQLAAHLRERGARRRPFFGQPLVNGSPLSLVTFLHLMHLSANVPLATLNPYVTFTAVHFCTIYAAPAVCEWRDVSAPTATQCTLKTCPSYATPTVIGTLCDKHGGVSTRFQLT